MTLKEAVRIILDEVRKWLEPRLEELRTEILTPEKIEAMTAAITTQATEKATEALRPLLESTQRTAQDAQATAQQAQSELVRIRERLDMIGKLVDEGSKKRLAQALLNAGLKLKPEHQERFEQAVVEIATGKTTPEEWIEKAKTQGWLVENPRAIAHRELHALLETQGLRYGEENKEAIRDLVTQIAEGELTAEEALKEAQERDLFEDGKGKKRPKKKA